MLVKWHFLLGTHKLLDPVSKTTFFFTLTVVNYYTYITLRGIISVNVSFKLIIGFLIFHLLLNVNMYLIS